MACNQSCTTEASTSELSEMEKQFALRLLTDETLLKKFSDYLSANGATISFQYTARHNLDEEEQLTDNGMFSLNLK